MGDLRLSRSDSFQPICRSSTLPAETKVAVALIQVDFEWNVDLVSAELCSLDVECILGISLQEGEHDSLVWNSREIIVFRCGVHIVQLYASGGSGMFRFSSVLGGWGN
ncbi:UNVERIFIED_CONTAM: hypothetical protein Sradi_1884000 [Sesamum radiatum]|uniref:Uncharacterized protein n=1 Tax=Sesamum radiatum TaxID=300843 RepID=A0AAW2U1H1_SESRA